MKDLHYLIRELEYADKEDLDDGDLQDVADALRKMIRLEGLANEFAKYWHSGNEIPVTRVEIRRESDLFLLLNEVLPGYDFHPFTPKTI